MTWAEYEAVQHRLTKNKEDSNRNASRLYVLRGMLFCGQDGRRLCGHSGRTSYAYGGILDISIDVPEHLHGSMRDCVHQTQGQ